jgi:glycine cleavage system aminomethyltransferase T
MCYLPAGHSKPGQRIQIAIRNQLVDAVTVAAPFYKRIK